MTKTKKQKTPQNVDLIEEEWNPSDIGEYSVDFLIECILREGLFTYDLETTGLSPRKDRIEGVAFYVPNTRDRTKPALRAWFPFIEGTMDHVVGGALTPLRPAMHQRRTMELLRPVWGLPKIIKVRHNGIFDDGMLYQASGCETPIVVADWAADSMLADYVADERWKRYGLKHRVEKTFNVKMTTYDEAAGRQSLFGFARKKPLGAYAMDDCMWAYRLFMRAIESIREQDPPKQQKDDWCSPLDGTPGVYSSLEKIFWKIEMPVQRVLMEMELQGCLIDWEWLVEVQRRIQQQKLDIIQQIQEHAGWVPNLRSPKQVSDFLFGDKKSGGLELPTDGLDYNEDLDQYTTRDKLIAHFGKKVPVVKLLLDYRSLEVIDRSFCQKLIKIAQEEGRCHSHFRQTGTVVGRLSSADPINLMNQPRDKDLVRKGFCSRLPVEVDPERAEMDFFDADYGQVELRMAAHLANEKNMIEVYTSGGTCTCDRFVYYFECKDQFEKKCKWDGMLKPGEPGVIVMPDGSPLLKCPKCTGIVTPQERCRHVDLHQRTSEDVQVKRNPLAKNCVAGDSMVLTEYGLLRIDEVVAGSDRTPSTTKIISDDGKLRQLDSTYAGGEQDVVSVEMEYGLRIRATPDHEFFVMERGKIVRRRADMLKPGDAAVIMTGRNVHGSSVDLPDVQMEANTAFKDVDLPKELSPDVARFFGYLVAEGRIETYPERGYFQVQFGFAESSTDMIGDFLHCTNALVGSRFNAWRDENRQAVYYTITSKKLNAWLDLMSFGHGSGDKSIPRCVRSAPWALKREFLRAYFEGDGTNKRPSSVTGKGSHVVSCCSKSELLIRQIQAELANVDILGYIHKETRDTDKGPQDYWCWSIRRQRDLARFRELIGFVSAEKQAALDAALAVIVTDRANRFLDNVEPLLEGIYDKVKRKQKDKLREVIHRTASAPAVRFGDTRIELLSDVLPDPINSYVNAGIWTAKVQSVTPAGRALVYDLYEPERTAMVIGCNLLADCNFGLLYRMGAPKFVTYADLYDDNGQPRVSYAEGLILKWHEAYPGIADWHDRVIDRLIKDNYIAYTLTQRRRRLYIEWRQNDYRAGTQAIQFKVSGSCQDIIKLAMIKIYEIRDRKIANSPPAESRLWKRFRFLIQVHDELVFEGPRALRDEIKTLVKSCMESVAPNLKVPLIANCKVGRTWDDTH